MEMILSILQSANVIAITAFLLTTVFLCYEIYLLVKQKKLSGKPVIPDFKTGVEYGHPKAAKLNMQALADRSILKTPNEKIILVLVFIMVIFLAVSVIGIFTKIQDEEKALLEKRKKVKIATSLGIKIYNDNWVEIKESELKSLVPSTLIKVSIATIREADIDKARIKINKINWDKDESQIVFDKNRNLFYKEYRVSSSDAKLSIEAQLHSVKDGWLEGNEQKK